LCDWLDLWPYGYIGQYRKFKVGIGLSTPEDIANIPEKLAAYHPDPSVADDCWEAMPAGRFEEILKGRRVGPRSIPLGMREA
jgi:hypothetical protein